MSRQLSERNSQAAANYALKKQEQIQRAAALKAERNTANNSSMPLSNAATNIINEYTSSKRDIEVRNDGGLEATAQSYGPFTEMITIRRPQKSSTLSAYDMVSQNVSRRGSARFDTVEDSNTVSVVRKKSIKMNVGNDSIVGGGGLFDKINVGDSNMLQPPVDPTGVCIDLSDRPLLCASGNIVEGELVVGGADHALYSIRCGSNAKQDGRNGAKVRSTASLTLPPKPVKMYSKRFGHTDWVSSVAHLPDGRVIR